MNREFKLFVDQLAAEETSSRAFNQYSYVCQENEARRNNLLVYLNKMYEIKPRLLLVGEAPGYRGCRLTGVPFTSEHLLMNNMKGLTLFGKEQGYRLASPDGKLLKEATATIIWETLLDNELMALGWNSFPFHPHKEGNPTSNRAPLQGELELGERYLQRVVELFDIKNIVAVGNKAAETLQKLHINCHKVRHPAQGGKNEFVQGIKNIKETLL